MVRRGPRGAVQALCVLQVDQRDAATVGQKVVSLLLVGEAGVHGGMLLSQQGALSSDITLQQLPARRLQTADLAVTAGGEHRTRDQTSAATLRRCFISALSEGLSLHS